MTFKTTMVYVLMRGDETGNHLPVGVFKDLQTAEGNADHYNLDLKERGIPDVRFYVRYTALFE
jgi:hypothetical protein